MPSFCFLPFLCHYYHFQALSKANQAQIKAKDATKKVEQAKKELEDIAAILATVQEPEPGLLEELARRVEEAEREFAAQDLDQKLHDLEMAKQRQVRKKNRKTSQINVKIGPRMSNAIRHTKQVYLLSHYEREVSRLKLDMESIAEIRAALPNTCWNRIRLEP